MADLLTVRVTIEPELDIASEVALSFGSTVSDLKQELLREALNGGVSAEDFGLGLPPPGPARDPEPLSDATQLTRDHSSLWLCRPWGPEGAEPHGGNDRAEQQEDRREREECREPVVGLSFEADASVEVYRVDVSGLGCISAEGLKEHLTARYRLTYGSKLRLHDPATGAELQGRDAVPLAPAEVAARGPGSVVQMLRMALSRAGPPSERRPGRPRSAVARQEPVELGLEVTSPEAFAANLLRALAERERRRDPADGALRRREEVFSAYEGRYSAEEIEGYWRDLCQTVQAGDGSGLRVVFLDVDGVLNGGSSMEGVIADCARRLARLVTEADAHVVLSTTWRHSELGRQGLLTELWRAGLAPRRVVGCTPEVAGGSPEMERASEICEWLDAFGEQPRGSVEAWVALDDMDLWGHERLVGHFVRTDERTGLTQADADRARALLNPASQSVGR